MATRYNMKVKSILYQRRIKKYYREYMPTTFSDFKEALQRMDKESQDRMMDTLKKVILASIMTKHSNIGRPKSLPMQKGIKWYIRKSFFVLN
jgi:hypothetical protein